MKLTNITLTVIPVLALAAPNPTFASTEHADANESFGTAIQQDNKTTVMEYGGYHSLDRSNDEAKYADGYERLHNRDLESRDDTDHYLEECNSGATVNRCVFNLIVPKGKGAGVCTERIQKEAWEGYMHILDRNIMCKYYSYANCKGPSSGPFSNAELDYSGVSYRFNQVIGNPQSFFCQNIGFQKPNIPVQPSKPVPQPPPEYSATLDYALAHSCPFEEVDSGDCFD